MTYTMKIITAFVFVLSFTYKLSAQIPTQTIRGSVKDIASEMPLPFVNVALLNTSYGTITDSLGNFSIENVSVGRYDLQVSMVGYETFVLKEIQVTSGKGVSLNISLKESLISISEVIVKPKVNKEQPLNEMASISAKMLSMEEAKRYAGGFEDPARLASAFAGISSNVGNNAIVIRGNSPSSLQWKIEGVEIPNPNHFSDMDAFGGGALTALSSQVITNSDFFLGAMPAEYNNALSGVFDIFMRNGNNQKYEHTFQLGALGIDIASEGPFENGGRASYLFNYRYSTLALIAPLLPENARGVKYQDLSFKMNFPTRKTGTFSFWGMGLIDGLESKAESDSTEWKYIEDRETRDGNQYIGAAGFGHKIILNNRQYVKSTIAATFSGVDMFIEKTNGFSVLPESSINNNTYNYVFSSIINTKFSARHTNSTGIAATGLMYDLQLKEAIPTNAPLQTIVSEHGFSTLLSAYSNSTIHFSENFIMNIGVNGQFFTLNEHYTIEPRIGTKYRFAEGQSLSFGYGLHSRLERLNYYFIKNRNKENDFPNKELDFSKAHHFVLGYDLSFAESMHLKAEVYYQHLFNVPVIADSSFSIINLKNDCFFNERLQNTGTGENYGLDVSLEKYLSQGYYYMLTASVFNSKYKGGDNILRDTRYNRNFAFNALFGKEWQIGNNQQNVLNVNVRFSYQGGERYSPIDTEESKSKQDAIFDENKAFTKQFSPIPTCHFTAGYQINRRKSTHEIAIKIMNLTNSKEFTGFLYNYRTQEVDERRETLVIPNLSYKIHF